MLMLLSRMSAYAIIIFLLHIYTEKKYVLFLNAYFEWLQWVLTNFSLKISNLTMIRIQNTTKEDSFVVIKTLIKFGVGKFTIYNLSFVGERINSVIHLSVFLSCCFASHSQG